MVRYHLLPFAAVCDWFLRSVSLRSSFLSAVAFLTLFSTAHSEVSWEEAIKAVEAKSQRYFEIARGMDDDVLGTAYNEINADKHRCSILGRMLGKQSESTHLDVPEFPEPTSGFEYRIEGQSLENWAYAARYLISLSQEKKIRTWNADCVGRMGIPATARIDDGSMDEFYDVRDSVLHVLGPVTDGYSSRLKEALDANPAIKTVALGSDGGNVVEALKAGYEIRLRGLDTTLWNGCYSACPLVFLGGTRRTMWSPYEEVGFHKIYSHGDRPIPLDSTMYSTVYGYVKAMGVDPEEVLTFMWSAEPDEIFVPSHEQLCESGVTTWIQRSCSARID